MEPSTDYPICIGCGAVSPTVEKPRLWYQRTDPGSSPRHFYACSRECIDRAPDDMTKVILPW